MYFSEKNIVQDTNCVVDAVIRYSSSSHISLECESQVII